MTGFVIIMMSPRAFKNNNSLFNRYIDITGDRIIILIPQHRRIELGIFSRKCYWGRGILEDLEYK
jgi:hypothetical protein